MTPNMLLLTLDLLVFLLILGTVVLVHELGHLAAALLVGVKVQEFGLGLPPRLKRLGSWRGMEISLNWLPLGGFIRPAGEYDPDLEGGFANSRPWKRIAVLISGPLANLLLGFLILTAAFMIGGPDENLVRVVEVSPGSPAESAGMQVGDLVVAIDGTSVEGAAALRNAIRAQLGNPIELQLDREGEIVIVTLVPRTTFPPEEGPAGFGTLGVITQHGLYASMGKSLRLIGLQIGQTGVVVAQIATGAADLSAARVIGPVGLKQASDWSFENALQWGEAYPVLYFASMISIGLGLANLLPIPALDGGRILMVLLEVLRGRRLDAAMERRVHFVAAAVLLVLIVVLTVNDLLHPVF